MKEVQHERKGADVLIPPRFFIYALGLLVVLTTSSLFDAKHHKNHLLVERCYTNTQKCFTVG